MPDGLLQPKVSGDTYTFTAKENPIITQQYTADPAAMVEDDKLWLFAGHDFEGGQNGYNMKDWMVFATTDIKTWTKYHVPLKITDLSWAKSGDAFTAQVIKRGSKY